MSSDDSTRNEQVHAGETADGEEQAEPSRRTPSRCRRPGPSTQPVVAADDQGQPVSEPEPEPEPEPPKTTLTMTIDDRPYEANPGPARHRRLRGAGAYVPRFCYHPRMRPVGMCRQCLVEVEGPRGPMMVVSCMTPVAEGQVVRTATPGIKRAQEGVLELLLANHPLDCPVCDKGGECPLQDQAYTHGPGESRYVEEKRHFEKPIPISALVNLDRERCILCDRCTRFADEVAGDPLISFTHRGNETQVLTFPDEPFASYFSGNTVQICPVGALTATPYRFKARPWDLEQVESTCTTCSVGCRIVVQSSRDELLRYQGVDSDPVNWSWLCDRGRFNFEAVNSDRRLGEPLVRGEGGLGANDLERGDGRRRPTGAARPSPTAVPTASPCSAAPGARTRTRSRGPVSPTRSASPIATPRSPTACPPSCSRCRGRRSTRPPRHARSCCSDPTSRRSCRSSTSACATPPSSARTRILELGPMASGLTRYAWRSVRVESGAAAALRRALSDYEVADQLASGPVVIVAGRGNLAESPASAASTLAAVLDACPGAKVLPALRRGNVVGALQLGLAPRPAASTAPASSPPPPRVASTCSSCSAPTRSPTAPTPTWPAGRWPAPAASSPSTRS